MDFDVDVVDSGDEGVTESVDESLVDGIDIDTDEREGAESSSPGFISIISMGFAR